MYPRSTILGTEIHQMYFMCCAKQQTGLQFSPCTLDKQVKAKYVSCTALQSCFSSFVACADSCFDEQDFEDGGVYASVAAPKT